MSAILAPSAPAARSALRRLVASEHVWSLGDQALVSATSFLSLFLIARWSDASQVGLYAVAVSVMAIVLVLHDSLVMRPYAVQMFSHSRTPREHALSALLIALGLALAASLILALILAFGLAPDAGGLGLALAGAIPAVSLREFVRRHAFANLALKRAFLTDLAGSVLCLGGLVALGLTGRLDAAAALVTLAWAFALPAAVALALSRRDFALSRASLGETLREGWRVGRWLLPTRLAMEGQGYGVHWASLALVGPALTGVYSASLAVIALANPLLVGLLNVMTPRAVRALKAGGPEGLRAQARGEARVLALVLGLFVLTIALAGETLMGALFRSEAYAGQGPLLLVLALTASAGWIGAPAAVALQSSGHERAAAAIALASFAVGLALVWTVLPAFGLIGAASAMLAVEGAASAIRWAVFLTRTGRRSEESQP